MSNSNSENPTKPDEARPSYHFPTRFYLKRTNICVFCDFGFARDQSKLQRFSHFRRFCLLGSSPAAPASLRSEC